MGGERLARALLTRFIRGGVSISRATHGAVPTWNAQPGIAYCGSCPASRTHAPTSRRSDRSGQRSARSGADEAFQGCCPIWWCDPGAVPTWKAQPGIAYSRSVTHLVWHHTPPSRRSARSGQRIAGRRCAAAGGGRAAASAGLVVACEAFQGCCPIWWCNPSAVPT